MAIENSSPLTLGNQAFRNKDYATAIEQYLIALQQMPALSDTINTNIMLARTRLQREQPNTPQSFATPATPTPKIAVVVHVYYPEICPEIAQYLKAITHPFDLFVTTTTEQAGVVIPAITADFPKVRLHIQPNNGMDVLPFLALIPLLINAGYVAVCKLHTKRGDGGEEGTQWRHALLNPLIGDNVVFTEVVQAFVQHADLQLVGPASLYLSARKLMFDNEPNIKYVLEQIEVGALPVEDWGFFAGSMFWVRPTTLQKLAQGVAYLQTQPVEYQADGQISHAVERLLGLVPVLNQGQVGLLHAAVTASARRYVLQIVAAHTQISQANIADLMRQYANLEISLMRLRESGQFDAEHYLAQHPGLVEQDVDLFVHYLLVGRFHTLLRENQCLFSQNGHVICNKNDDGLSINLIGHASSPLGLGEDLRQVAFALLDHGIPFSIIDIPTEQTDPIPKSLQPYVTHQATHPISLFCVSPFTYAELVQADPQRFAGHYRIGNFLWELEHFPSAWAYILNQVHEIWVPTRFVQDIYTRAGCLNVFKISTPATPPVRRAGSLRKRLGLSSSVFVFGFMFDLHSVIKRKNPAGLISAYLRMKSLQPTRETALLIKVHRSNFYSEELVALKASCANHHDIHFFEETLPAHEVVLFYNTIDAYVSLHRSEGLGRTLIEAAQLGLPVICTEYSGSSDIVALGAALGVESQLIPCQPGEYPNCEGSVWAEPDLDQAAELMSKVAQNRSRYLPDTKELNEHFSRKVFVSRLRERLWVSRLGELPSEITRKKVNLISINTTVYFNLSTSKHWRSHPVGIIRVERELAKYLNRDKNIRISFVFFDTQCKNFKLLSQQQVDEILQDSWCNPTYNPKAIKDYDFLNINEMSQRDIFISVGLDWDLSPAKEIGNLSNRTGCKVILFCHDTVPLLYPEYCVQEDFDQVFKVHFVNMAHVASKVVANSSCSRTDLIKFWESAKIESPLPPVEVLKLGSFVVQDALPTLTRDDEIQLNKLISKWKYVLYVSSFESRKNHEILLHIWRELYRHRKEYCPTLVFVGMAGWGMKDLSDQIHRMLAYAVEKIIWLNNVNDNMLKHLYKNCSFAVFPSSYEGWGLAATEALSFGKICVVSNNSSLNEATQNLMPSYHPYDYFGWKQEIERLLDDATYKSKLEEVIRLNYKHRTWNDFSIEFKEKIILGDLQ